MQKKNKLIFETQSMNHFPQKFKKRKSQIQFQIFLKHSSNDTMNNIVIQLVFVMIKIKQCT